MKALYTYVGWGGKERKCWAKFKTNVGWVTEGQVGGWYTERWGKQAKSGGGELGSLSSLKRGPMQTFLSRSNKTILAAMENKELKLSQGKEEGRIEVYVLQSEERHKGKVLRHGSCDPDVFQQANERIWKASYKPRRVCRSSLPCSG